MRIATCTDCGKNNSSVLHSFIKCDSQTPFQKADQNETGSQRKG